MVTAQHPACKATSAHELCHPMLAAGVYSLAVQRMRGPSSEAMGGSYGWTVMFSTVPVLSLAAVRAVIGMPM